MNYRVALAAAAAATGLIAAGLIAVPHGTAAAAASGCSVKYTVANQWSGGFQGDISITNLGDPLTNWSLGFDFPDAGQKVTQGWSGTFAQTGARVTVTNMSYNGALATNASVSTGFLGSWSGANPVPTNFTVNGTTCTGGVVTTTPTTTTTTTTATTTTTTTTSTPPGSAPALHVSGNHLVTAAGANYRLLGVNRSGGEYECIQGRGMWDGPMDQASVDAMKTWNIHTVRVPLNEECWLGTGDVPAGAPSGATYQQNVKNYVTLLVSNGITPILDLQWTYGQYTGNSSGCSDVKATCLKPMPDARYAPSFWSSMAAAFKDNRVVFDLFNEPYPERATGNATSGWTCWRDGGTCPGIGYQVAGFQSLVNAIRATGNTNVLLIGGLAYSNDLTGWLQHKPTDPTGNVAADAHIYNFNSCSSTSCLNSQLAPVAAAVPLTFDEIGENDCVSSFMTNTVMPWADAHGVGYSPWVWDTWDSCTLIRDYAGTPTTLGAGYKAHLLTQNP